MKSIGSILTVAIWVIWISPQHAKQASPFLLSSSWIQWTSAGIVAVLVPLGVLTNFRRFVNADTRRSGFAMLVLCVTPLVVNLTMYAVAGPITARTIHALSAVDRKEAEYIAKFTRQAVDDEAFTQRQKAAIGLYSLFGVQAAIRDEEGTLSIYVPSEKDTASWTRSRDTKIQVESTNALLDSQLKQYPWLFALNLGAFVLIVFGTMGWQTYFGKNRTDVGKESDGLAH